MIDKVLEFLKHPKIQGSLYHFTDHRNLESINTHGLVSKDLAASMGLRIEHPGGNEHSHEADRIKGLTDYVNLCFSNNHPMEYRARKEGRIEQTRFLRINPEILRVDGAKITLDVANKAGVPLLDPSDALKQIDYEVLYTRTDWNDPAVKERLNAARKCEILIPTKVARELIISGL
jgi:hypothetical protein